MTALSYSASNTLDTFSECKYIFADGVLSLSGLIGEEFSIPRSVSQVAEPSAIKFKSKTMVTKVQKSSANAKPKSYKTTRPRRVIPENKEFIQGEPTEVDVTGGRGGKSNHHAGNKTYWELILQNRNSYRSLKTDPEKRTLAHFVATAVAEKGGRFLLKDGSTGKWFKMPEKAYIDKIQQAFRDKYIAEWAQDWMQANYPTEYALFLQEQNDKKGKAGKKRKTKAARPADGPVSKKNNTARPSSGPTEQDIAEGAQDWMQATYPTEYALFLQEQKDKKEKADKKRKTEAAKQADGLASKKKNTVRPPSGPTEQDKAFKIDTPPLKALDQLQSGGMLNFPLCYSDGGLSFSSMSSLKQDLLVTAYLNTKSSFGLPTSGIRPPDASKGQRLQTSNHWIIEEYNSDLTPPTTAPV